MDAVVLERDRVGDLDRRGPYPQRQPEGVEAAHHLAMEIRYRSRRQRDGFGLPIADSDAQLMVDEVEIDLEIPRAVRHRRGGKAASRQIKRHMPPMVYGRGLRQADLADDLGPPMQRGAAVLPRIVVERRPSSPVPVHVRLPRSAPMKGTV